MTLKQKYLNLTKKLGKFPSIKDVSLFICSERQFYKEYTSLNVLKKELLEEYPFLKELTSPSKLSYKDIELFRLNKYIHNIKNSNQKELSKASFVDYLEKHAGSIFKGQIKAGKLPPKNFKMQRVHTLVLSDLHFGADIDVEETGVSEYNKKQESRRFASIIYEAANYKIQYRKNTKLVITLLGDIIENSLHDQRTGANISEQVCRAIHLLSQGIGYLANHYPEIEIHCATGNHGRITSRHDKRAIHGKYDSYETIIYYALRKICQSLPNVKFFIPKTPIAHYQVFGHKIAYTHGDTVFKVGNPYTSVNVKGIETQVNKINASLHDTEEYKAIILGHVHIGTVVNLPNGVTVITNGGLPPPDPFAVSLGQLEANNGQWIFESVPEHAVGDLRFIKVNKDVDKNTKLDTIIKSWEKY